MRRVVLLILLCLALPLAASASSIDLSTDGGTISATATTLSLSGDALTKYGAIGGSNLGTVTFTTGAFTSGDVMSGGTLGAGGTFTISGNGSVMGVPNGVIFTGAFTSATWTFHSATSTYTFVGDVTGSGGAATITEITLSGTLSPNGTITVGSGDITLVTSQVPEPGTLGLLGTGLVGLGGLLRRKRIL
jgi:PEP-CTERM motif